MLKQMLLIGAAALSFPALAQEQPVEEPSSAPMASEPMAKPVTDAMAEPGTESTPPADEAAPSQPAPADAPATATQIAQIVENEFAVYDADANGELNEGEFAAWMKKLRTATEPGIDPESESVKAWIGQAFAAADTDKSTGVNKSELTGFLARGA